MPEFGIIANAGVRQDVPHILINDAFSPRSENIRLHQGEARKIQGRLAELTEQQLTGTCDVTNGSPTVEKATGTVWFSSATHYPAWGSDDLSAATGRTMTIDGVDYTIKSITDADTLVLDTNYAGSTDTVAFTIGTAGTKAPSPDGNTIRHYHEDKYTIGGTEIEYLMAFTSDNIYLWDTTWYAWILKTLSGGLNTATLWSTAVLNNDLVATNNVDFVIVWDVNTPGSLFVNLDGASGLDLDGGSTFLTRAKHVISWENYIILGHTTEGGTVFPYRIRNCSIGDHTDYDETGTGDTGSFDFSSGLAVRGLAEHNGDLIIGMANQMKRGFVVTSDDVMHFDTEPIAVGWLSPSTIRDKKGRLYYLGTDSTIREIRTATRISKLADDTMNLLKKSLAEKAVFGFIQGDDFNEIWLAAPIGDDATGNNKVIAYKPEDGTIEIHDFAIAALSTYSRQTVYTIDTIPFDTIDGISWSTIDTIQNTAGFFLDICSDYSGFTYTLHSSSLDDGAAWTGTLEISTALVKQGGTKYNKVMSLLNRRKVIQRIWFYFNAKPAGTVTVSIKRNRETSWTVLSSSVSLINAGFDLAIAQLTPTLSAGHLDFKLESTGAMELIGIIIEYELDGDV